MKEQLQVVEYIPGTTAPIPTYDANHAIADAAPTFTPRAPMTLLTITPTASRRLAWGVGIALAGHAVFAALALLILLNGHVWSGLALFVGLLLWLGAESLAWDVWLPRAWRWRLPWIARQARWLALVAIALGLLTAILLNHSGMPPLLHAPTAATGQMRAYSFHPAIRQGSGVIALAPDGDRIAVGATNGVAIWDRAGTRLAQTLPIALPPGASLALQALAWSPDSASLAASYQFHTPAGNDQAVAVWDAHSGAMSFTSPCSGPVYALAWSPDSMTLAGYQPPVMPTALGVIWRWASRTGDLAQPIFVAGVLTNTSSAQMFAWSPDGSALAVSDHGDALAIVAAADARVVARVAVARGLLSVAWSPDGAYLATGQADGAVTLWDAAHLTPVATIPTPLTAVRDLHWSPSGADLLGADNGQIALIHVASHQLVRVLTRAVDTSTPLPIIPELHPLPAGKPASSLTANLLAEPEMRAVAWSAHGQAIGALYGDGTVVVWELTP